MTVTRPSAKQRGTLKLLASSRDGANEELLRRLVIDFDVRLTAGRSMVRLLM